MVQIQSNISNWSVSIPLLIILLSSSALVLYQNQKSHNQQSKSSLITKFQQWKQTHNIHYQSKFENEYRFQLFTKKIQIIQKHNSNPKKSYTRGLNQFSALTQDQFKNIYLTLNGHGTPSHQNYVQEVQIVNQNLKANIDWRTMGAVGPVKNQGICGSCWAFSTVAGLEAISAIFYNKLQRFSQQQLVDCDYSNRGCVGGQMRFAIDYVKKNGINLQSDYPYKQVRGLCSHPFGSFKVSGWSNTTGCSNLANSLTSRPIVVGVDANTWDDYQSGIFDNCKNDSDVFNHGVLLVGMSSNQYWLVKNSFGTTWGQNGYMRLKYGDTCNICDDGIVILK